MATMWTRLQGQLSPMALRFTAPLAMIPQSQPPIGSLPMDQKLASQPQISGRDTMAMERLSFKLASVGDLATAMEAIILV